MRSATPSCGRGRLWHRQRVATPTPHRPASSPTRRPAGRSKSLSVSTTRGPPSLSPQPFPRSVLCLSFACCIPPRFTHPLFPAPHTAPWPLSSLAVSLPRRSAAGGGRRCAPPAGRRRRGHGWRPAALSLTLAARSSCRWSSTRRARPKRLSLLTTRRRGAARARYVLLGSFWLRRVCEVGLRPVQVSWLPTRARSVAHAVGGRHANRPPNARWTLTLVSCLGTSLD